MEHFTHGAGLGIRGCGPTVAAAFEEGARGLTALIIAPERVPAVTEFNLACSGPQIEILFVEWLNLLIYEMTARSMVFGAFNVTLNGHTLTATVQGAALDPNLLPALKAIRSATFTEVAVAGIAGGEWLAQCVVDTA